MLFSDVNVIVISNSTDEAGIAIGEKANQVSQLRKRLNTPLSKALLCARRSEERNFLATAPIEGLNYVAFRRVFSHRHKSLRVLRECGAVRSRVHLEQVFAAESPKVYCSEFVMCRNEFFGIIDDE